MRELKFRAWNKKGKRWLGVNLQMSVVDGLLWWQFGYEYEIVPAEERENIELMQYTGLKDKNGKEIYEGDFLEGSESGEFGSTLSTWVDVVVWDKEKAAFVCMDVGEGDILGLDETDSDKVIGNIYTHPEWLERIRKEFDALRGK